MVAVDMTPTPTSSNVSNQTRTHSATVSDSLRSQALPTILVVDDEFAFATLLKSLLESRRMGVTVAGSLETGISLVRSHRFSAALLDVRLGQHTAAPLAQLLDQAGTPFIFLTGYSDLNELPSYLRNRPCLAKPVDPNILIQQVENLLDQSGDPNA